MQTEQASPSSAAYPDTSAGFKVVGLLLIALLMLAFYIVCSLQVRKAEVRNLGLQVQQTAFSDCLQYVVGSTIASCTSRLGAQPAADAAQALLVSGS